MEKISLTTNQVWIIQGFLCDYDTIASNRVAEYLQKKIDESKVPEEKPKGIRVRISALPLTAL